MTEQERDAYIAEWRKSPPEDTVAGTVAQVVVFLFAAFIAVCFFLGVLSGGH